MMKHQVNIYQLDLKYWYPALGYLTKEDFQSISTYNCEKVRLEKLASLFLKRKYIGSFTTDLNGKPVSSHTFFSIAHSGDLVLCAICDTTTVGVDIEHFKPFKDSVIDYVLSDEEKENLKTNNDFYSFWTAKESLTKCEGHGMTPHARKIPALPLNGVKTYLGEQYYTKSWINGDYAYAATIKGSDAFNYQIIEESPFVGFKDASQELKEVYGILLKVWTKETCAPRMRQEWDQNHPSYGQCSVTAYLIQDLFGGEVRSIKLEDGSNHCFNIIDEKLFDLTSPQFNTNLSYDNSEIRTKEELLQNEEKTARYLFLKERVLELKEK